MPQTYSQSLVMAILAGSLVLSVAFVLRYLPHMLAPLGIGVDHWYWKEYIEKYRSNRKFPPDLPQYLLEMHQWYPPVFPLLLAYLPQVLFDRFSHVLAVFLDLLRMISLMYIVYSLTRDPLAVGVSGAVYALTPLLIAYNVQLNPRGLAAVMLDLVFFTAIVIFFFEAPSWLWWVLVPASGLILLTHKMTTQLFWFFCLVGGVFLDWVVLFLIPLSILVALILSKGFYWKVLLHHWDIVTFWHRNWPWLGANPIKESPIYGLSAYESPKKFHRTGIKGIVKHLYSQCAYNPFAWLMVAILPIYSFIPLRPGSFVLFVAGALGLTLVFALATALLPSLRSLGAGHLYLYNAAFPASLLWGLLFHQGYVDVLAFLIVGAVASLFGITRFYVHIKQSTPFKIDSDLESAMDFLASRPRGAVMCVPAMWYDVVAYKTGQPVLYGGHGYGFKMLEETWPRLLISVEALMNRYNLRYILYHPEEVTEKFLADVPLHSTETFGKYKVISIEIATR